MDIFAEITETQYTSFYKTMEIKGRRIFLEILNEYCYDIVKESIVHEKQCVGDSASFWPEELNNLLNELTRSELTLIIKEIAVENVQNILYAKISNELFNDILAEIIQQYKIVIKPYI